MAQINTTTVLELVAKIAGKYAEEIVSKEIALAKERIDSCKDDLLARIAISVNEMIKSDSVLRNIIIDIK